jgi:hypothetical protein
MKTRPLGVVAIFTLAICGALPVGAQTKDEYLALLPSAGCGIGANQGDRS